MPPPVELFETSNASIGKVPARARDDDASRNPRGPSGTNAAKSRKQIGKRGKDTNVPMHHLRKSRKDPEGPDRMQFTKRVR